MVDRPSRGRGQAILGRIGYLLRRKQDWRTSQPTTDPARRAALAARASGAVVRSADPRPPRRSDPEAFGDLVDRKRALGLSPRGLPADELATITVACGDAAYRDGPPLVLTIDGRRAYPLTTPGPKSFRVLAGTHVVSLWSLGTRGALGTTSGGKVATASVTLEPGGRADLVYRGRIVGARPSKALAFAWLVAFPVLGIASSLLLPHLHLILTAALKALPVHPRAGRWLHAAARALCLDGGGPLLLLLLWSVLPLGFRSRPRFDLTPKGEKAAWADLDEPIS